MLPRSRAHYLENRSIWTLCCIISATALWQRDFSIFCIKPAVSYYLPNYPRSTQSLPQWSDHLSKSMHPAQVHLYCLLLALLQVLRPVAELHEAECITLKIQQNT